MLTKTNFRNFVDCSNEFWLNHNFPEPAGELSLNDQLRRETGYEVETLARTMSRFANGSGHTVEFGKEFKTGSLYAKADIVVTDLATGNIEIYEVKSGTKVKDEYQIDLTFQCIVASKTGTNVSRGFLITLDNSFVFDGELDPERLFRITDETEYIEANRSSIEEQIEAAITVLDSEEPAASLLDYCKGKKLECSFIRRHFPDIPEYNVSHIFNAGSKKLNSLLGESILSIPDIPADFAMTEREAARVAVERTGNTYIDRETIRGEIDGLVYPLNFLDYESFNPGVPKFLGTRPYQQMVFQYSLHTMEEPGGDVRHSFHLSRNDGRHPTEEIVERLHDDLNGQIGTIIIWSEGFEKSRNTEMGEMFPDYAPLLNEMNEKVYDLRKIFSRQLYMHPGFRGRDSIKKVLPVVTNLSYDGMEIADGLTASIKWYHAATGRGTPEEREKTFADLVAYCHLDTLAMVEIYRHLLMI